MAGELDQAVEQVRDVLYQNCEGRFDARAIAEALLAAGWRPPTSNQPIQQVIDAVKELEQLRSVPARSRWRRSRL